MKKILYIVLTLFFCILLIYLFQYKDVDKNNIIVPENYTIDKYTVAEVTNISCKKSVECITPGNYLLRSSCPYTSLCIKDKCNIICPSYNK